MAGVSEADVKLLSDAILASREAASVAEFPTVALELTTNVVRNDQAGWNEIDPVHDYANAVMLPARELTLEQRTTMSELVHEHPLIMHVATTGDGSAIKISDFVTSEELHARRIYQELFRGLGLEHQISIGLPSVLPRITAIALNRNELGDDFDERDRLMLDTLRPHLAQSYEQVRERQRLQRSIGALSGALEGSGTHAIVLDPEPDEVTRGALVLLYRYFGRPGARDAFPARFSRWLDAQRRAARAVRGEVPAPLAPVTATVGGSRLVVRYLPPTFTAHEALLLDESTAPVRAGDLERLGLTGREAEILELLGSGATNAVLASQLHVSLSTVKTHLEHVYRKLGVRSRAQAVAMALTLLPAGATSDAAAPEIGRSAD